MSDDNESAHPGARPGSPPQPGMVMNLLLEVPEVLLLACQQVMAGAPTALPEVPWRQEGNRTLTVAWGRPPEPVGAKERRPPSQPSSSWPHFDVADFWRRSLRSFRNGLTSPSGERRG